MNSTGNVSSKKCFSILYFFFFTLNKNKYYLQISKMVDTKDTTIIDLIDLRVMHFFLNINNFFFVKKNNSVPLLQYYTKSVCNLRTNI